MTGIQATGAASFFYVESPHVVRNLRDRLFKRRNELAEHVAKGGCVSMDQYAHCVGQIEGLLEAVEMLDELEKQERN